MEIIIATRGSKLALWQANLVKASLQERGIAAAIRIYKTQGDLNQENALYKIGGKGLFTKALDDALVDGSADIAVHSTKDIPTDFPEELETLAFMKREDPRDVLLALSKEVDIDNQAKSYVIGTSSTRRAAFLKHYVPNFEVKVIRGNVDTRINKMKSGDYDGIILAYAGVKRMGLTEHVVRKLNPTTFTPAIGQGAIGVMARKGHPLAHELRTVLDHKPTSVAVTCERAFLKTLGGGCSSPAFGLATVMENTVSFQAGVASLDGKEMLRGSEQGHAEDAEQIGISLAKSLLVKGASQILNESIKEN